MGAKPRTTTQTTQKAKMDTLQIENERLKQENEDLRKINGAQVRMLVEKELLQIRVRELEAKLANGAA